MFIERNMKDNKKGLKYSPIINGLLKHINKLYRITPKNRSTIYLKEEDKALIDLDIDFDRLLDIFQIISPLAGIRANLHEQDYFDGSFKNFWLIEIINEERFNNFIDKYSRSGEKNKLIICKDGKVVYFSGSGKEYSSMLSVNTNEYKFLYFLATHREKAYKAKLIVKLGELKEPKATSNEPNDDRRVRDLVKVLRKKFRLNKNNPDNFFIVDNSFYGIKCDVELPA
ncbi:hypothetical protein COX23_05025 [Candidatus Gottesmanbacteria bacterium CG23_combo_of_CG06-09_8_20_14_all_37_19]|nr:MAG: hypothetical protein COX23_05025 [Candidatus Gottesmanbacteria bacterium CG23_combo_of_CG06-09_8_20_14_all_37_19]